MAFLIDDNKCLGCGACAYICLFGVPTAVNSEKTKYVIDAEKCYGCGQCENICPNDAIHPAPDHKKIKKVYIDPEKCIGCSLCARACHAKAPKGVIKSPFEIDQTKCFKCGLCATKCRKEAIIVEYEE
ncbi:MAG: 4Fe-4S binding protein [Clostridiales bacterium]|nr:4Fe-4S binding protein [Clostridiales bacterium]